MLRIAIDYTPAYEQGGGIGRYVRELVTALSTEDSLTLYHLFVSGATSESLPRPLAENFTWKSTQITPKWLARIWHRVHLPLPVEFFTGQIDLYHATDFVLPPTLPATKTLLTVHDLSFVLVPEAASPALKRYLDRVVPRSIKKANHVLADSTATKSDLITHYNTPHDKITVLYSGVDAHFQPVSDSSKLEEIQAKYGISGIPYIFSVGTVQPRKNYSRVIQALANLQQQGYDFHYVIAGGKGWLEDEIHETISDNHLENVVHLLGFVDDEDLPALYTGATCTAFVSLYEGFGFPILESMACGTPVVTSNRSSLPEVAGEAALLVDPFDTLAIMNAIKSVLDDKILYKSLVERGLAQVKRFSWAASARQLREIYARLLSTSNSSEV